MKYVKIIFIFFISLNLSALCAEDSTLTEPTLSADIQNATIKVEANEKNITTATSAEENELQDWDNHLKTLKVKGDNWVAENNVPTDSWTTEAFNLAEKAMATDDTLSEELKTSFSSAIKEKIAQENGTDTLSSKLLIKNFDEKIEELKKQTSHESTTEKTEEQKTADSTKEKISASETQQAPGDETVTTSTESTPATETTTTSSASTESKTESDKKTEAPKEEAKKENLIEEWNNCLKKIKDKQGNIERLTDTAAELALNLLDPKQNPKPMKKTELTQAFERTLVARGGLSPAERDLLLSDFASALGIYIPTSASSMDYYQSIESELTMLAQQEDIAEMQHKQTEQEKRLKAAEQEAEHQRMLTQAALLEATKKQQLSVDQWQKTQESLMKAEQKRLTQLQDEADQLKEKTRELESKLQKAAAKQKADAEKSLFTRAYETVSETVSGLWSPSKPKKPTIETTSTKEELIKHQQRQKEILQEKEALSKEMRCKRERAERAQEIKELTNHKLTKREMIRKAELEAEQKECARIADMNNFERQKNEWQIFMDEISNMKHATEDSNEKLTAHAIKKATSLITIASRIPSINILDLEQMLKETFAKALLKQQRGNPEYLNTTINQHDFDRAINNIKKKKAENRE